MVWSVSSNKWKAPKVMTSTQIDLKQQYPLGDVSPSTSMRRMYKTSPWRNYRNGGMLVVSLSRCNLQSGFVTLFAIFLKSQTFPRIN